MSDLLKCDKEIFENGKFVAICWGPSDVIEKWIVEVRNKTSVKIDWHRAGGYAKILGLGDMTEATKIMAETLPEGVQLL